MGGTNTESSPLPLVVDQLYEFVLSDVLGLKDDSPIVEALIHRDILDLPSLVGMSNNDIDEMTVLQPSEG